MAQETHYDAFISYRHSPLDQKIATALHRKLENYTLPRSVAQKIGKKKLERVFRDTTELSVSAELSEAINDALIHSDYLIVICSPRFQESEWCMKEVETFLKLKGKDHILLVLIEGEPEDSFPEILRYEDVVKKDINGEEVTVRETREPLAAECRGKTAKELNNAIDDTTLRLCSAIFGIKYDDLKQRHREAKIKQRVSIVAVVFLVLLLIISQSIFFLFRLRKQNRIIEDKLADSTASGSVTLLREGRTLDAVYAARSVLPKDETKGYNANAFRALADATGVYTIPGKYRSNRILSFPSSVLNVLFSADGRYVTGLDYNENKAYVLDTTDSSLIHTHMDISYNTHSISYSGDNAVLFVDENKIISYTPEDDTERELIPKSGYLYASNDYSVTLAATDKTLYGISNGEVLYEKEYESMIPDENKNSDVPSDFFNIQKLSSIVLSSDGKYAAALFEDFDMDNNVLCEVICFDSFTGKTLYCNSFDYYVECVYFDGKSLITLESSYEAATSESTLHRIDIGTNTLVRSVPFNGESFYGFYACGNRYLLYNTSRVVLLDERLDIRYSLGIGESGVTPFTYEGGPGIFLMNGKLYLWSEEMNFFYDAYDFGRNDNSNLKCYFNNGIIYILKFNSDFITVYEKHSSPYLKEVSETEAESALNDNDTTNEPTREDSELIVPSDDNKFYAVQNTDWKVAIYDADTKKCVFDTYSIEEEILSFCYVEPDDVYVLSDFYGISIFTPEFKFISRIDNVGLLGRNPENGHLIISSSEGNFELSIATYEEVIGIADEMLGDYRPDERIQEKYGLK